MHQNFEDDMNIMSRISDKALRLYEGDHEKANEWMVSSNPIFGGYSPLSSCKHIDGARKVEDYLNCRVERLNQPARSFSQRYQEISQIANKAFIDSRRAKDWLYSKSIPHFDGKRPIDLIKKSESAAEKVEFVLKEIIQSNKLK